MACSASLPQLCSIGIHPSGPVDPDADLYTKAPVFRKNSTVQEVLEEMDNAREAVLGVNSTVGSAAKVVKLKDKVDFSRKQGRLSSAGLLMRTTTEIESENVKSGGVDGRGLPPLPVKENVTEKLSAIQNCLVDISFTVSR